MVWIFDALTAGWRQDCFGKNNLERNLEFATQPVFIENYCVIVIFVWILDAWAACWRQDCIGKNSLEGNLDFDSNPVCIENY